MIPLNTDLEFGMLSIYSGESFPNCVTYNICMSKYKYAICVYIRNRHIFIHYYYYFPITNVHPICK